MNGIANKDDINNIENILASNNVEKIRNILVPYIKYYKNIKIDLLINLAYSIGDELIVSEVIKTLGYAYCESKNFKKLVLYYCNQVAWDYDDDILSACLGNMNRLFSIDEVSLILKANYNHANPIIRDEVVFIARKYLIKNKENISQPCYDGSYINEVEPEVKNWFGS